MSYPLPSCHALLEGVTSTGASEWVRLPLNKVFEVKGITTATVEIQYRVNPDGAVGLLNSFTADGVKENHQAVYECRANVTSYTSGTIYVYVSSITNS